MDKLLNSADLDRMMDVRNDPVPFARPVQERKRQRDDDAADAAAADTSVATESVAAYSTRSGAGGIVTSFNEQIALGTTVGPSAAPRCRLEVCNLGYLVSCPIMLMFMVARLLMRCVQLFANSASVLDAYKYMRDKPADRALGTICGDLVELSLISSDS